MLRTFMFVFFVQVSQFGWSIFPCLLDWGLGCEGRWAKHLSGGECERGWAGCLQRCAGAKWEYVWDVADDSQTFRLDNTESEIKEHV